MDFPFLQENTASRAQLEGVVRSLSASELARANADGWTVAALLAHLAFWDQRAFVLLRRWKSAGVDESPIDPHAVNAALQPLCLAIDPHKAAELCLSSAAAVDGELETLTPELFTAIEAGPTGYRFNRALHRTDHLTAIAQLLGR